MNGTTTLNGGLISKLNQSGKLIGALLGSVAFTWTTTALPAEATTYRFDLRVINEASAAINRFCISPTYDDTYMCIPNWERLYSGYYKNVWVTIPRPTCFFDYKAVFADGDVVEKHSVNLCQVNRVTFYDN